MGESFKVFVTKDYLKFSAAHFIAYKGFRENLHGHNYRVSVEVEGRLGGDGYVVDFGVVKKIARELCGRLDERVLIPAESDVLPWKRPAVRWSSSPRPAVSRFPAATAPSCRSSTAPPKSWRAFSPASSGHACRSSACNA